METVNHTNNRNERVTHTSNGNFEQKLLSNRTIPVFPPVMNPGVDQGIAPVVLAPQMLLTPATNEVVADAVSGGAQKNMAPQKVSKTSVAGSTPYNIRDNVNVFEPPSSVLIGVVITS